MISFENYMKSLLMIDTFKTCGDLNIRSSVISSTLNYLEESNPNLHKALQLELNRQHMI